MKIYTVRAGDTPESVAGRCGLSFGELAEYNGLSDPSRLCRGLALLLPDGGGESRRREAELLAMVPPGVSGASLGATAELMSFLCPFSARLLHGGGLAAVEDGAALAAASGAGAVPLLAVSNIDSEKGGFSPHPVHQLLTDMGARERFTESLCAALEERGYMGALFHFQYLFTFDGEAYGDFLAETSELLHRLGYYIFASIAPCRRGGGPGLSGAAQRHGVMARCCDRLILLSGQLGGEGPASPLPRLREALDAATEEIDPGKLLMELPCRAIDRPMSGHGGADIRSLPRAAAADLAVSLGAELGFDPLSASAFFSYTDQAGRERRVWYEDVRGMRTRLELAGNYALAGISLFCGSCLYAPALRLLGSMLAPEKLI